MLRSLLALLVIISLPSNTLASGHASPPFASTSTAEIFYVGFGGDPYSPITRSNIEDEHERYGEMNVDNLDFKRLMTILSRAQTGHGCFNPKRVRLKIRTRDSIVYVDETGVVEGLSVLRFLGEAEKKTVQRLIESEAMTDSRTTPLPPSQLALEELETCN